jgi:hypothetical protein
MRRRKRFGNWTVISRLRLVADGPPSTSRRTTPGQSTPTSMHRRQGSHTRSWTGDLGERGGEDDHHLVLVAPARRPRPLPTRGCSPTRAPLCWAGAYRRLRPSLAGARPEATTDAAPLLSAPVGLQRYDVGGTEPTTLTTPRVCDYGIAILEGESPLTTPIIVFRQKGTAGFSHGRLPGTYILFEK